MGFADDNFSSSLIFFLPICYIKKKKYYHKAYPTPAEV